MTNRRYSLRNDPDYLYNEAKKCNKKKQAFELYRKAADLGSVEAQFETGKYYYEVDKSYDKAFEYFRKASSYSHAEAQYYIGEIYYNGYGRKQSYMSAIKWYKLSAEHGFDDAIYKIGLSYIKSNDLKSAKEWLEKAVKAGCGDAKAQLQKVEEATKPKSAEELYNEAKALDEQHRYDESFDLYKKSAEMGYTKSLFEIALSYYTGIGAEENYQKAFEYFKKAADKNNAEAQYYLGSLYYNGDGVKQNYTEAVKWYTKGANNRNPDAMNMLGVCYHDGKGIKKNPQQAISWYRKAADKGHDVAQYNLAECYWNGDGIKQNKALAFSLYEKAAEQGHASANNALGLRYHSGDGRKVDIQKAIMYYQRAAEAGLPVAMYNLGFIFNEDMHDVETAREWLEKAVEAGYEDAQEYLDGIDEDNEDDDSAEYDEEFDEYDEADYSNDIDIPQHLEITYDMKKHEDFYTTYNRKYFNPYGSNADKNFIYSLFFYIDASCSDEIVKLLNDVQNYAETGNTEYESATDYYNALFEYFDWDGLEETERKRAENAKKIVDILYSDGKRNILESTLQTIYDTVADMQLDTEKAKKDLEEWFYSPEFSEKDMEKYFKQSHHVAVVSGIQSDYTECGEELSLINDKLCNLINEVKSNFQMNKNKAFSYFDEVGGIIIKVLDFKLDYIEKENDWDYYNDNSKSADKKSTAASLAAGFFTFGLASKLAFDYSDKLDGDLEKQRLSIIMKYAENTKEVICLSAVLLAFNISSGAIEMLIDDYDFDDENNDFFDEI